MRAAEPHDQRPAGEHADFPITVEQQERHVLMRVTRRQPRTESQATKVHLVSIMKPGVGEFPMTGGRRQNLGALSRSQLMCTGKEVGVQMGVGRERHRQLAASSLGMHRS